MMKCRIISLLAALVIMSCEPMALLAQDSIPYRISTWQVGGGTDRILDTYLSQEHFQGAGMSFLYTADRFRPGRTWHTLAEHQASLSAVHDRPDQVKEIQGDYTFLWGRLRRIDIIPRRLTLDVGGMATANIGFIYNTYNSNNPAQGRLSLNVMPTAAAEYTVFSSGELTGWLKRSGLRLRYEVQLPLVGVMFSPNYGQSYYEIFSRGNYDHNIVPTTFVSSPSMRHQFMADINVSRSTTLRIGYLGDFQQASVNDLKSHIYAHRLMVGFVKKFSVIPHRP